MLPTVTYPVSGKIMTTNADPSLRSGDGYPAPQPSDFEGHLNSRCETGLPRASSNTHFEGASGCGRGDVLSALITVVTSTLQTQDSQAASPHKLGDMLKVASRRRLEEAAGHRCRRSLVWRRSRQVRVGQRRQNTLQPAADSGQSAGCGGGAGRRLCRAARTLPAAAAPHRPRSAGPRTAPAPQRRQHGAAYRRARGGARSPPRARREAPRRPDVRRAVPRQRNPEVAGE